MGVDPMLADVALGAISWELTPAIADATTLLAAVVDDSGWK
jgi:hypothetical protein